MVRPWSYHTRQIIAGGEVDALGQLLNVQADQPFHGSDCTELQS
jgi:hypothetical protein